VRAPTVVLSSRSPRSPNELAAIDEGWGVDEPKTDMPKPASARHRAPPRPVPRPAERLRGQYLPVLSLEVGPPALPKLPPRTPGQEPAPALGRIHVAVVSRPQAPRVPAVSRETTSLAGVPTLKELLAARAAAREAELLAGEIRYQAPRRPDREAAVLFPALPPAPQRRRDVEGERALFAFGTLVGAIAVGLSVLVALLLK